MRYAFFAVCSTVLTAATLWKLYQLVRAPRNLPLRWLTYCLGCVTGTYALSTYAGQRIVDSAVTVGTAKVVQDVMAMATCFTLLVFYLYSAEYSAAIRRRTRREALVFCGAVALVVAAAVSAPRHAVLHSTFEEAVMTVPQVLVFYLGIGLYMCYALTGAGLRTHHYARMSNGAAATGLRVATVGLAVMVVCTAVRAVFALIRLGGGSVPDRLTLYTAVVLASSTPVFVAGVTWPGVHAYCAACRLRHAHRRAYRQLEPLWHLLSSAFPDIVLPRTGRGGGATFRYARRIIECRDGLLRIGPHLAESPAAGAVEPTELASRLRRAAGDVHRGRAATASGTPLWVMGGSGGEADDVQYLVVLSQALRTLPAKAA
ncbi:MAB_1171c family putative transporter [Streptomyces sp. NPDC050504]|uniref:MAB_1171c family putative transporter n=1 Tax=Streptomyces sp. NPDC050504 TaxID=3365618 RepID=UPI00378F329B